MSGHFGALCAFGAVLLLGACGGGEGGASGPSISLTFDPASVVVHTAQGISETVDIVATASGDVSGTIYIVIEDSAHILSGTPSVSQVGEHYNVQLITSPSLAPGHHTGAFKIHLCPNPGCTSEYGGSPYSLPYDVTIDAVVLKALIPFEDETGLKLFDPRQALSASNPAFIESTGWEASHGVTLLVADWDGTQLSGLRTAAQVYKKDGKIYRVNLDPAASHAPVQISNIDTACGIERVYQDYQNPDSSWLLVWVKDGSGTCTTPQTYRMVKAGASPTTAAVTPVFVWPNQVQAVHAPNGAITGFLSFEAPYIVRRDANLANTANVLQAYDDDTFEYHGFSYVNGDFTDHLYFVSRASGDSSPSIYRYHVGSGTLTPISTYGQPSVPIFPIGAVDSDNYYWGSGGYTGAIYRVAHSSTTPARMSSAAITDELRYPRVTNARVVVERVRNGSSSGIYALAKDAADAVPAVVVDPDNGGFTSVYNANPNGTLLITNIVAGSIWTYTSYVAKDDGTVLATLDNRQWKMRILDGVWDPVGGGVARYVLEGAGSYVFAPSRQIYDAATGELLAELPGISNNDYPTYGAIGFGRYVSFDVRIQKAPSTWDWDAYILDTISGVQSPVLVDPEHPGYGVLSDWHI